MHDRNTQKIVINIKIIVRVNFLSSTTISLDQPVIISPAFALAPPMPEHCLPVLDLCLRPPMDAAFFALSACACRFEAVTPCLIRFHS